MTLLYLLYRSYRLYYVLLFCCYCHAPSFRFSSCNPNTRSTQITEMRFKLLISFKADLNHTARDDIQKRSDERCLFDQCAGRNATSLDI